VDRGDLPGRFAAVCRAVRTWALTNPNEYALIYGSPVPGYVAPADTVGPAIRVSVLLMQILIDAVAQGRVPAEEPLAAQALEPILSQLPPGFPPALVQRGLMAWTGLFGAVSFELYGQLHQVVAEDPADRDAFFAECIGRWITFVGLTLTAHRTAQVTTGR